MKRVPELEWSTLKQSLRQAAPEAFVGDEVGNLYAGKWQAGQKQKTYTTPIDGTTLGHLPMLTREHVVGAVEFAEKQAGAWAKESYASRREKVSAALKGLKAQRDLIARLLMWEIGKTWKAAQADVDRCISGVEWYVESSEAMLQGRTPLGVVSNIASWNYPLSVLAHAVLVQVLCGNVALAKTPTDGGLYALTLSFAIMHRAGLPVTLLSGSGAELADVLVAHPAIRGMNYVGGKTHGRAIAARPEMQDRRLILEMDGVNSYGVYRYSDWAKLGAQIQRGFEYGKQRCTAYVRWVVERSLFPKFLETYLAVASKVRVGNPTMALENGAPSDVDFGPLISAAKVAELRRDIDDAMAKGAIPLFSHELDDRYFGDTPSRDAYMGPKALVGLSKNTDLYFQEPFGPVDTFILVDSERELVTEMNVSNGALVSSLATDDLSFAKRISYEIRAFKVGINEMRSRGDREELFGGTGSSWQGAFVGGHLLIHALTEGPNQDRLYGNFGDETFFPPLR